MNTTVKDVMTTRVIWVKKDATFREMAAALHEHGAKSDLMESRAAFAEKRKPNWKGC